MKRFLTYLALIPLLIFASCSGDGTDEAKSPLFEKVKHKDDGLFRGVNLGMTVDEVKNAEDPSGLKDDEEEYLYYDFEINDEDSYTVAYTFYEGALYRIELETYLEKPEQAANLFKDLKAYFNSRHGDGVLEDDGYTVWTGEASNGNKMEIAMIDDSQAYGYVEVFISDLEY